MIKLFVRLFKTCWLPIIHVIWIVLADHTSVRAMVDVWRASFRHRIEQFWWEEKKNSLILVDCTSYNPWNCLLCVLVSADGRDAAVGHGASWSGAMEKRPSGLCDTAHRCFPLSSGRRAGQSPNSSQWTSPGCRFWVFHISFVCVTEASIRFTLTHLFPSFPTWGVNEWKRRDQNALPPV